MPTTEEIAHHLFLSRQRIPAILKTLGLDHRVVSMDAIRKAYLARLRDRAGNTSQELMAARVQSEKLDQQLKLLTIGERSGELVRRDEIEPRWLSAVTAARTELLSMSDRLVMEIRTVHGTEVDRELIDRHVQRSLNHLAGHDSDPGQDDVKGDEVLAPAAEHRDHGMG